MGTCRCWERRRVLACTPRRAPLPPSTLAFCIAAAHPRVHRGCTCRGSAVSPGSRARGVRLRLRGPLPGDGHRRALLGGRVRDIAVRPHRRHACGHRHAHRAPRRAVQQARQRAFPSTQLGVPPSHHASQPSPVPRSRVFLCNGRVVLVRPKLAMANDGNYREGRWFSPWDEARGLEELPLPGRVASVCRGGQRTAPIGHAVVRARDASVGVETCEELFAPLSPHVRLALNGDRDCRRGDALLSCSRSPRLGSHASPRQLTVTINRPRALTPPLPGPPRRRHRVQWVGVAPPAAQAGTAAEFDAERHGQVRGGVHVRQPAGLRRGQALLRRVRVR